MLSRTSARVSILGVSIASALGLAVVAASQAQCIQGDVNGDGLVNGIDLSFVLTNWGQACPTVIESVWPPSGLPAGGTTITITGSQLGGVQGVTIGGAPATNVVSVNSTTIIAVTPPSKSLGPKDVVVITTAGSATLASGFTYSPLAWALPLEVEPDPEVITDPEWRERIVATGLPWRVRDIGTGIEMLLVPPGTFMMGCSASKQFGCGSNEYPVHQVTLTQAFYLGRYEVTQAQWSSAMGSNPSIYQGYVDSGVRPVERVSWLMIQGFEATTGMRLPTEAEWEYSSRAGTNTAFNIGSNDDGVLESIAWVASNADGQTRPVGQKAANGLGLHDMHGNVWEFCEDVYAHDYYSQSPSIDPTGPESGNNRVKRGGSWDWSSTGARVSIRHFTDQSQVSSSVGFRVAKTP